MADDEQQRWRARRYVQRLIHSGQVERPTVCSKCSAQKQNTRQIVTYHPDPHRMNEYIFICKKCRIDIGGLKTPGLKSKGNYPPFEVMQYELFVEKISWPEFARRCGVSITAARSTYRRRCAARGISPHVPGIAERGHQHAAESFRQRTNTSTISALGLIDEVFRLSRDYDLPYKVILSRGHPQPKQAGYLVAKLTRSVGRPRLIFKEYDRVVKAINEIDAEHFNYHELQASLSANLKEVLKEYRRFSLVRLHRCTGVNERRLGKLARTGKGVFTLEELQTIQSVLLEWRAWNREMKNHEFKIKSNRPPSSPGKEPAPTGVAGLSRVDP